jgi:hypothetical protein
LDEDGRGDVCDPNPNDPHDLEICLGDLGSCEDALSQCESDLTTCDGDLETCNAELDRCQVDLAQCGTDLATCASNLADCVLNLERVKADLDEGHSGLKEIIRLLGLPPGRRSSEYSCSGELCGEIMEAIRRLLDPAGQSYRRSDHRGGSRR